MGRTRRTDGTTGPGRRGVLRSGAALGAGALAAWTSAGPATATGEEPAARPSADGAILARQAGPYEILALRDAAGPFPGKAVDHFPGATAEDWARAAELDPAAFGADGAWHLAFWCYAIRRPGGRTTLVDTGVGPEGSPAAAWAPVPGHLPEVLRRAGIAPADVDTVVLTHLHEDHYGWAVGPDGTPMFPGARHLVQRTELAALGAGDSAQAYVVAPLRRAGLLHVVDGATRLHGGAGHGGTVSVLATPGHTPGHQSVLVDGGRSQVVVTGDVLVHAVQLADPAVAYGFEKDPATARRTREDLLARAARDRALLATMHLNDPFRRAG